MSGFDGSLPMMLYRTLDAVMPAYRDIFSRHGLTEQQWRILRTVWTDNRVTSAELSRRTLLSPPSLVSIVDRLVEKGFVVRVPSPTDRRATHIVATPSGRELQEAVIPQVEAIQARVGKCLSASQWAELETLLDQIAVGMTENIEELAANG